MGEEEDAKTWEGRKPGPVRFRAAIIYLALQLPAASSDQPERARSRAATYFASKPKPTGIMSFCLFLLQVGFTKQPKSPWALVGSYPTVSPLLSELSGLLSVALSLVLRPVDVIDHLCSMEPGLSSLLLRKAIACPSQAKCSIPHSSPKTNSHLFFPRSTSPPWSDPLQPNSSSIQHS